MSLSEEQQAELMKPCVNQGNPVFSYLSPAVKCSLTAKGVRLANLLYRTTSSDYGRHPPTFENAPHVYRPKCNKFSDGLRKSGMYRNSSFNTAVDRSQVYDCPNLQHTL